MQIVHSNRREGLTEIEEAWIIHALHREDGLSQPEIGRLLGHHKSWVNRRLLLAEALSEELQADLRLGLVGATGEFQDRCRLVIHACFALDFEDALSYSGLRQTTRMGSQLRVLPVQRSG